MDDQVVSISFQTLARNVVQALATDTCPKIRRRAFKLAFDIFDRQENDSLPPQHDTNHLSVKAIPVFVKCLVLHVSKENWEEVDNFCRLLCMCIRCPDRNVIFRDVGSDLLTTLISSLNMTKDGLPTPSNSIVDLLHELATIQASLSSMSNSKKLIHFLQQIIRGDANIVNSLCQIEAMRMLAGLARQEDNTLLLMRAPSLVDDVLLLGSLPGNSDEYKAEFVCSLSWSKVNQGELLHKRALIPSLLKWSNTDCIQTRLNVMKCFRHLSANSCNKRPLAKNRSVVNALLVASQHEELCPEAVGTIVRLIGNKKSAQKMMGYPFFLQALLSAALLGEKKAAQAMKKLATHMPVSFHMHQDLIDAVIQIAVSDDQNIRLWAARAFLEQSRIKANNFYLVRMPEALDVIIKLANDPDAAVEAAATEALYFLSNSANANKLISVSVIVQTLAQKAGSQDCETGRYAVQALLTLVDHTPMARMAKKFGLVASLSKFGVSKHPNIELKQAALNVVIAMAPLL